jgi:predicted ABC-type sugar transport system permease subunit
MNAAEKISAHDLRMALCVLPILVLIVPVLTFLLPRNKT